MSFGIEQLAIVGIAAAAVGLLAGILVGRLSQGQLRQENTRLSADLARSEGQLREQTRTGARLRNEQRSIANFARSLPTVVRELNRWDLEPRSVPDLLIQLVDALFEPDQVLIYMIRSPNEEGGQSKEIYLRAHRGLRDVPESLRRVRIGEGKIGWVAAHRVEMSADDWLNLTRTEGRSIVDNHPAVRLDVIAPLVQHKGVREHLLGVICVGRPGLRPGDEKLMLQVVANLGALALMNVRNIRHLAEQANHDGLTGLFNKRYFMTQLGLLINRAERTDQQLGVFIFDIDHFKIYNDANGHLAGDELLKTMARLLRENLRPEDVACRYGGEEFVVAMPETDGSAAHQVADRIREAIASHPFTHADCQPEGQLTISGGVAAFPADGTNGTELIGHADQALYKAKGSGRNRVVRYRGVEIGDAGWQEGDDFKTYDEPHETLDRT